MQFEGQGKWYQPWLMSCLFTGIVVQSRMDAPLPLHPHQKCHQWFDPTKTFSTLNQTNPTNSTNPTKYWIIQLINQPTHTLRIWIIQLLKPPIQPTNQPRRLKDIMHVEGCNQVWAGDLSCETKALVRKVRPGEGVDWRMVVNLLHRAAKWSSNDVSFTSRLFPSVLLVIVLDFRWWFTNRLFKFKYVCNTYMYNHI